MTSAIRLPRPYLWNGGEQVVAQHELLQLLQRRELRAQVHLRHVTGARCCLGTGHVLRCG